MFEMLVDKPVSEMNMVELAHNCCYGKDREAMYRDYDKEISAREFTRNIVRQYDTGSELGMDADFYTDDDVFDETMLDWLQYDTNEIAGLIALFYRNLWAMADLYEYSKHTKKVRKEQFEKLSKDSFMVDDGNREIECIPLVNVEDILLH